MKEKVDGFELRLDHLPPLSPKDVSSWTAHPLILTWKGGSEANLLDLLALEPAYVDLPSDAPKTLFETIAARYPKTRIICSYHNSEKTPSDLPTLFDSLKNPFAHHIKIACTARSTLDSLRMLHLVKKTSCIGLCMGTLGALTRILAPVVGTPLLYVGAPGQIGLNELLTTYRFPTLNSQTKIYGLIGNPVEQSPSHRTHNALFSQIEANAVYLKMLLEKEELPQFFSLIETLPFFGLSVTAPFKEILFPHLATLSPEAKHIGAVNTLVRMEDAWHGTNTDGKGGLDALGEVKSKRVVILGAGGAAKALAFEAKNRGAHLTLCNRTQSKGERLAEQLGAFFSKTIPTDYDILINTTPKVPKNLYTNNLKNQEFDKEALPKLHRRGAAVFIDTARRAGGTSEEKPTLSKTDSSGCLCIKPGSTIMDLPSAPTLTPLLQEALKRGCKTIPGFHMFIHQAIRQFEHWLPEKNEEIRQCLQSKLTTSTSTTKAKEKERTSSSSADLGATSFAGRS